jgi:D-lactate dehydrogenase
VSGHDAVLAQLRDAVGSRHVLTGDKATAASAVATASATARYWRWCARHAAGTVARAAGGGGAAIILQAANTGLTGGSTPDGNDYGRPIVLVSTLRLTGIQLLNEGRQVLCLPGATLDRWSRRWRRSAASRIR